MDGLVTLADLQRSVTEIKDLLSPMSERLATLEERSSHAASRAWVLGAFLSALGAVLLSGAGIAIQLYLHAH